MPSKLVDIPPLVVPQGLDDEGPYSEIIVPEYFPPGSIMLFETQMHQYDADLDTFCKSGAAEAVANLDLVDLNVVLHRSDGEERDVTGGEIGTYNVPGLGALTYCGLEGWMHPLRHIMLHNDLGHPLCGHLRDGSWAMDYVSDRLLRFVLSDAFFTLCSSWTGKRMSFPAWSSQLNGSRNDLNASRPPHHPFCDPNTLPWSYRRRIKPLVELSLSNAPNLLSLVTRLLTISL